MASVNRVILVGNLGADPDLETAIEMARRSDDEVIVYGLVEIGRTVRKTVFVPA